MYAFSRFTWEMCYVKWMVFLWQPSKRNKVWNSFKCLQCSHHNSNLYNSNSLLEKKFSDLFNEQIFIKQVYKRTVHNFNNSYVFELWRLHSINNDIVKVNLLLYQYQYWKCKVGFLFAQSHLSSWIAFFYVFLGRDWKTPSSP